MSAQDNLFLRHAGVQYPIICGPMYPCSNPELVSGVSNSGALGIIQPIALTYVHGYEFSAGIDYIQSLTDKPVGMNLLIEKNSEKYQQKMQYWMQIALEKGIRFFITSLGKPDWVVSMAHEYGAFVYHDVTEVRWAEKAIDVGVDGLIAVNNRAGGHAGNYAVDELAGQLRQYGLPLVCAGGVGCRDKYIQAMGSGYQAVQMGTRFIASNECSAPLSYKQAIIQAHETDIVLSERITGIPVSVINTDYIKKMGLKPNMFECWMLKHPRLKYYMRTILALKSLRAFKISLLDETGKSGYWQAGKSVESINSILTVDEIIKAFTGNGEL
ncbi:Enoyl-[acyl-carrier-protein] reductase [FMN] [hydrothermal vent metagenome]|uniref:Enoyl-[acyl-carrier-protein] reductase [FMN] n=1 Tax=hydrothermal vent metagenome TaxID=652676 RepID=A0A3B0XS75_9ZZZZ